MPLVALASTSGDDPARPTGSQLLVVVAVCAVAGALWQVLHRRDLADRLTPITALFSTTVIPFLAIGWDDPVSSSVQAGMGLCAVVTGLVFTEQCLRGLDGRVARRRSTPRARSHARTG